MTAVRSFTSSPLPPRERGVEFGRALTDPVRRSVAGYAALFARRGATGYDARRWAAELRDVVGDLDPDALAEIGGIAEGAGVDELDVVAVNARTELLAKADPYGERECSAALVAPRDGSPAFGVQTWDWYASMADTWLRWRIPLVGADGADAGWLETVTEYGLLAKIGVSSRGVGVLLNMLHHESDDNDRTGFPVHLLSRRILTSATSYDDAAAMCHDTKVCASTALTVLDRERGGSLELFSDGPGVVEPTDGLLVRTNHFVSAAGRDGCLTTEDTYPSSYVRLRHLDHALRDRPPRSPDDVLTAMEHHDPAGGVCRHPQQDSRRGSAAPPWPRWWWSRALLRSASLPAVRVATRPATPSKRFAPAAASPPGVAHRGLLLGEVLLRDPVLDRLRVDRVSWPRGSRSAPRRCRRRRAGRPTTRGARPCRRRRRTAPRPGAAATRSGRRAAPTRCAAPGRPRARRDRRRPSAAWPR